MSDENMLQDILETVHFLRDNSVSRDEFNEFASKAITRDEFNEFASKAITRDEFNALKRETQQGFKDTHRYIEEIKDEMITHIDQFISLNNKLDTELAALRIKCDRLEASIKQIFLHLRLEPAI